MDEKFERLDDQDLEAVDGGRYRGSLKTEDNAAVDDAEVETDKSEEQLTGPSPLPWLPPF